MCILSGFPTLSNKAKGANPVNFPFGVWFANPTTLYVADEGDGSTSGVGTAFYTHAAAQTNAGLEKWVLDASSNTWKLAYVLTNGLELGIPYTVEGYPTGLNAGSANSSNPDGLPWSPATDGLRKARPSSPDIRRAFVQPVLPRTSGPHPIRRPSAATFPSKLEKGS